MLPSAWILFTIRNLVKSMASFWCAPNTIRMSSMHRRHNVWPINCNCTIHNIMNPNLIYWNDSHVNQIASSTWMLSKNWKIYQFNKFNYTKWNKKEEQNPTNWQLVENETKTLVFSIIIIIILIPSRIRIQYYPVGIRTMWTYPCIRSIHLRSRLSLNAP